MPSYDEADFRKLLRKGSLWHFRGKIETILPNQRHRQVVLQDIINDEDFFFLSVATSQVEKRKQFIEKRKLPKETLVIVWVGDSKYFQSETAFNGNHPVQYGVQQLFAEYSADPKIYIGEIEKEILEKILEAVRISPLVSSVQKTMMGLASKA